MVAGMPLPTRSVCQPEGPDMAVGKIVLITVPYDQGDILPDFLDWHLELGVDMIVAQDGGSTDGSREILEQYSKTQQVDWFPLAERDMSKYNIGDSMARMAIDMYGADWIILLDVDEFLCTRGPDLRSVLSDAERADVSVLNIRRHAMTGSPIAPGQRATQALTVRVDRVASPSHEQMMSGELPAGFLFVAVPGHLAVRGSAFSRYGPGAHAVETLWGSNETTEQLYILHYALRGFGELETKVRNIAAWFEDNKHLAGLWGWHWKRWLRLHEQGRLREDYNNEFLSPERAAELIREGVCSIDDTIATWLAHREAKTNQRRGLPDSIKRIAGSLIAPFRPRQR